MEGVGPHQFWGVARGGSLACLRRAAVNTSECSSKTLLDLPHSDDAERSVLGGLLIDPDAFESVAEIIGPADFFSVAHATVFRAMTALARSGRPIDRVMVKDQLMRTGRLQQVGGEDFVDELDQFVPAAGNVSWYARVVAEKAILRRVIGAAEAIAQLGPSWHGTGEELCAEAAKRIRDARTGQGVADAA